MYLVLTGFTCVGLIKGAKYFGWDAVYGTFPRTTKDVPVRYFGWYDEVKSQMIGNRL